MTKTSYSDAISSIEDIIEDARNGRMFILVDHEDRENGDGGGRAGHHRDQRPPRQHRQLRRQQFVGDAAQALYLGFDPHKALHQSDIAERVGRAGG